MTEQELIAHRAVIYTTSLRLRGEISLSPLRRLSDFVSDISIPFVLLERCMVTGWRGGSVTNVQEVAVGKENMLALLLEPNSPAPSPAKQADIVLKDHLRMKVFAPPFLLSGCMHIAPKANWLNALNGSRSNFIGFTDVTLYSLDRYRELASDVQFALVNCKYIAALLPGTQDFPMSVWNKENEILVGF